jgi:hypothetical protein
VAAEAVGVRAAAEAVDCPVARVAAVAVRAAAEAVDCPVAPAPKDVAGDPAAVR